MIMQLHPKGKKLKELDLCFQMFVSYAWSIDFEHINKQIIYSNILQKMLQKKQMQKSKLALPKTMKKKFFLLLQMLTWWQMSFKNTGTCMQGYQVNQIIPRQTHQWKISHRA